MWEFITIFGLVGSGLGLFLLWACRRTYNEPTYTLPVSRYEKYQKEENERQEELKKHNDQFAPYTLRISPSGSKLGFFFVEEWRRDNSFGYTRYNWQNILYFYKDRDGPLYKWEYPSRKEAEEVVFKILQDRADKEENQRKLRIFIANNPPKIYT